MPRRVFVTGGGSGLGRAIASRFAREGDSVAIGDVNAARGHDVERELRALGVDARFVHCDVTKEDDLRDVATELESAWGGVDVVVNNAGVAQAGAIEDVPLADWEWVLDVNLLGVVRGCKVFTPMFKKQGHGHFVNVASMAGLLDVPRMSSYAASKAAVVSLSETLQFELASSGIGVTVVCPSFFRTNLAESLRSTDAKMHLALEKLFAKSSVSAEDIADEVVRAVTNRTFYVLPHREGRLAWWRKRFLPREAYVAVVTRENAKRRARR